MKTSMTKASLAAALFASGMAGQLSTAAAQAPGFLLQTDKSVLGEPLQLPPSGAAEVLASIVTLQPGETTPLHRHGTPMFADILEGEVTVNYGDAGQRTYPQGAALMEAMAVPHAGTNTGDRPVKILTVYFGPKGATPVLLGR